MKRTTTTCLSLLAVICLTATMSVYASDHKKHEHRAKKMHKHFNQMDTNGDKLISKEEHMAFAQKRFDKADTNQDGMLSMDELKARRQHHKKQRMEKKSNP